MNELEKYAASLPSPLSREAKIKLIEQWKIDNNWGKEKPQPAEDITYGGKPVEEVLELVKTEGDAAGAGVELEQTSALVDLTDLTLENGSSDLKPIKLQSPTENYSVDGKKVTAEEFNSYTDSYTDFYAEYNKNLNPQGALLPTVKDKSIINVTQDGKTTSYSAKQIRSLIENKSPGFEDISNVQEYVDRFGDNAEIVDQYKRYL